MITNGKILAEDENMREICDYLDSLTLSIDSIDNRINEELGRGKDHYHNIKTILDYIKDKQLDLTINTVVSKKNIKGLNDLGNFLQEYKIKEWRVFKFMPLRETAGRNKDEFEITDGEFGQSKSIFKSFGNFLRAKNFHLTTATPEKQLEIIQFLRQNSKRTSSVDTIDGFVKQSKCKEVFDNVDIAFIDKEYTNLLDCKAPIKIIKYGKQGCLYHSVGRSFSIHSRVVEDKDIITLIKPENYEERIIDI